MGGLWNCAALKTCWYIGIRVGKRYLSGCVFVNTVGNESYAAQNQLLAQDSLPNVCISVAVSMKGSSGPAAMGLQVRAMHRLKVWIYPLEMCTVSDMLISPSHSTASTCCLCWTPSWGKTELKKNVCICKVLCAVLYWSGDCVIQTKALLTLSKRNVTMYTVHVY